MAARLVLQARRNRTTRWDVSLRLDSPVSHQYSLGFNLEEITHPVSSVALVRIEQDTGVGSLVHSWEVEVSGGHVATATSDRDLDTYWRSKVLSTPLYHLSLA